MLSRLLFNERGGQVFLATLTVIGIGVQALFPFADFLGLLD